jgi:glycosyltransferase involved in cell wall biosynthesis
LYLGRLKRYKRVDLIVDALAHLIRTGGMARLLIVGRGDAEPELRAHMARLGLEQHVDFRGYVDEEEKRRLLRKAWVHVFTSPKEGWGISNLEAAACGTPTVASDSPGLRDSVLHDRTGFLVPHGDTVALAERLRLVLEQPDLRRRLAEGARLFALDHGWDRAADQTEAHLQAVLDSAPPALRDRTTDRVRHRESR